MSLTVGVEVSPADRETLESWTRASSIRAGLAERARIMRLSADGVGTGEIVRRVGVSPAQCRSSPARRHQQFLAFLKQVAKAYPGVRLHVVCDSYATHKHPAVRAWLERNPRITLDFTPTSGSWLNMVEVFFGIITRQAIRRGTFTSVKTSSPLSRTLSTAGTTAASGSFGRRPPTTYSTTAAQVNEPRLPRH